MRFAEWDDFEYSRPVVDRLREEHAAMKALLERQGVGVYKVESVEWGHPLTEVAEGTTRITVHGTVSQAGAGDTISYLRAEVK